MFDKNVKFPAHRVGLPGKETVLTLHPLSPPTRRGLRDVLPVMPDKSFALSRRGNHDKPCAASFHRGSRLQEPSCFP